MTQEKAFEVAEWHFRSFKNNCLCPALQTPSRLYPRTYVSFQMGSGEIYLLPGSNTYSVAKPSKANRTNILSHYAYHINPRNWLPHKALSCLSQTAEGIELL